MLEEVGGLTGTPPPPKEWLGYRWAGRQGHRQDDSEAP